MEGSEVGWSEAPTDDPQGVDHLGMRVAGEGAYSRLFDFTTSVSWRPRYFSFLCWALGEAFRVAGGVEGASEHKLNITRWREHLKRLDYLMAAVSLCVDPKAVNVAGERKVRRALEKAGGGAITLGTDHLRASTGSLAIYAGPMRQLGLIESAGDISRPTRRGRVLAQAFECCLTEAGLLTIARNASSGTAPVAALQQGGLAALTTLPKWADTNDAARSERAALRHAILDSTASRRVSSIGIVLALHKLLNDRASPSTADFREATLLGGIQILPDDAAPAEVRWLELPKHYESTLKAWRIYQAHAYATLASEYLLAIALKFAARPELTLGGEGTALNRLLEAMVDSATSEGLLQLHAQDLNEQMVTSCTQQREARLTEVELAGRLDLSDADTCLRDSALLLVSSLARCAHLENTDGAAAWLGDNEPSRLSPRLLAAKWREAVAGDEPIPLFLARWIREHIINQHRSNALRKLAADPNRYTAKFSIEGEYLIPLAPMEPGTSSPRFDNVARFMSDLGYLDAEFRPTSSADDLLDHIAAESAT